MATVTHTGAQTVQKNTLSKRYTVQRIAFALMWTSAAIAVGVLIAVIGYVLVQGVPVILDDFPAFLTTAPEGGLSGEGGMSTTIITTIYLVGLILIIAGPLGIGAAIYLVEYAGERQNPLVKFLIWLARFGVETLAGVPSIIFGLFGYALFVLMLQLQLSLISGALAGACLVLPTIIRTTEEALLTVPRSYREGSLALGATKWQTIWNVVLPAALPGIITGIVLTIGRIVGETAVFFVTLGGSHNLPQSLTSGGRTMSLHVYYLAMDTRAFDKAMGTAAVLIISIITINLIINLISRRLTLEIEQ